MGEVVAVDGCGFARFFIIGNWISQDWISQRLDLD